MNLISPSGAYVCVPSMFIFSMVVGALPGERATTSTPRNETGTNRMKSPVATAKINNPRKTFSDLFMALPRESFAGCCSVCCSVMGNA